MAKKLLVTSPYPNLRGTFIESGSNDGRPAFVRDSKQDGIVSWIFFSSKFGKGPCWYFGRCLPQAGSLNSFCCSIEDAASPEDAKWPSGDIAAVKDAALMDVDIGPTCSNAPRSNAEIATDTPTAASCSSCDDLDALSSGLRCVACSPSEDAIARSALSVLKDYASTTARKQMAAGLVRDDADVKQRLAEISAAHECRLAAPLIVLEPADSITIGGNTTALTCEAICFSGGKVHYQWIKDGSILPRAERSRLMLCGPKDIGTYACQVTVGSKSASSRSCEVKLSATEAANRARYESPMRRAAEAQKCGNLSDAISLISQAIKAAEGFESQLVRSLCWRAELLNQLERWQDAFNDASEAVRLSGGLARAHAARGTAAVKLGLLAEAVSSWETAEILGGVPEAAQEAEKCRQRLQEFFEKERVGRDASSTGTGNSGAGGDEGGDGPEASWRRNGWHGRYPGGGAGNYFGGSASQGHSRGREGGYGSTVTSAVQQHLQILGLSLDVRGKLPTAEAVRASYRRLALQAHPDKPGGSKTAFQALQNAYEAVLAAVSA